MDILIQPATIQDLDLLMDWRMEVLHEVFHLPKDVDLSELTSENRKYYQEMLPTHQHIACFAKWQDEIVGCGSICIQKEMPSPDNPNGLCGYIMNIYTRKPYRQQGIGQRIVDWLIKQAKEMHVQKIYLEASVDGKPLYQKMGFHDMEDYMKL